MLVKPMNKAELWRMATKMDTFNSIAQYRETKASAELDAIFAAWDAMRLMQGTCLTAECKLLSSMIDDYYCKAKKSAKHATAARHALDYWRELAR